MTNLEKCIAEIEFRFPCVRDHEFTSKEWQTLKTAVLAQQTNNSAMDATCDTIECPDCGAEFSVDCECPICKGHWLRHKQHQ